MKLLAVIAFLSVAAVANARVTTLGALSPLDDGRVSVRAQPAPSSEVLADRDDDHGHHGGDGHGHGPTRGWGPRPGWQSGWHYQRNYHPHWYGPKIVFPGFIWLNINPGVWQCTAFNQYDQYLVPYSYVAVDQGQAAYGALYDCGGPNYQVSGCYIPPGYCQRR